MLVAVLAAAAAAALAVSKSADSCLLNRLGQAKVCAFQEKMMGANQTATLYLCLSLSLVLLATLQAATSLSLEAVVHAVAVQQRHHLGL